MMATMETLPNPTGVAPLAQSEKNYAGGDWKIVKDC